MTPTVSPALRALLAGSVDYAGLFPPAGLALEPALDNQAGYVRGEDAWMLGRFVLPTAKMPAAGPCIAGRFDSGNPLRISALVPKADSAVSLLENLRLSLVELADFQQAHAGVASVDQLEVPLPPDTTRDTTIRPLLREAAALIETISPKPLSVFWEVPLSGDAPATVRAFTEHDAEAAPGTDGRAFGVKFRTGGTEPAAFPSSKQLAVALLAARDAGVALKFTAGLHHPIRHFDEGIGTRMHGFLNVFAAVTLAREHRLDTAETQAVLEDERPESFRFHAEYFAWRDRHVSTYALAVHRLFVTSFGSCSFDEPRDDLRHLGLMT